MLTVKPPLGIDSSSPPPPADAVVRILLDRYSARVRVVEILVFRAEFYREDESPGARAILVMFEDSSACAAGLSFLLPPQLQFLHDALVQP